MKKYIIRFVLLILFFYIGSVSASDIECRTEDGEVHVLGNDPSNGTNVTIDGDVFWFKSESKIGNKKVSTYVNDAGIISNIILIIDPVNNKGDAYVVVYLDTSSKRDSDVSKLYLHCKI